MPGREQLIFRERILSLLLVVAIASLGLEMRIVTELTVLELRGHAYGYECCILVILDRIELAYCGQLRKDRVISPIRINKQHYRSRIIMPPIL